jgi:thioredoxin-like negative regulator of GroEL
MAKARRHWQLVLALLSTGVMLGCGWKWWQGRRYRDAKMAIEAEMAAGRHAIAARNLTQLMSWSSDSDEAAYLLGICEQARGRNQAATEAWARVTPGSPFSARAINACLSVLIAGGRFAAAEQLVNDAAQDPRNDSTALRILLLPTFSRQGRLEDSQRLIVQRWEHLQETGEGASELAINLARLHAELQWTPIPVEAIRADLHQAATLAPDDDRVWLGQANLAIRTGNLEGADRWLDACLKRRPDDIAVWRARLSWGMAAGRVDVVREALTHVPATDSNPAQVNLIEAWLAASQGDPTGERKALDRLVATDPTDLTIQRRLAELARRDGQPDRTAEMHRRQAEFDRLSTQYRKLYERNQPIRDAAEMGHLAEKLGRSFEARAFLSVAAAASLNHEDARRSLQSLSQQSAPFAQTRGTLADVVAAQRGIGAKGGD